ncbi:MAG: binding domain, partial [Gemmatimonadota bacterium]
MKIVIIGSGIAGLSAAIALRSAGATVIVYERAPELTEVGAG